MPPQTPTPRPTAPPPPMQDLPPEALEQIRRVLEIPAQDWQAWRHHPVSKVFLQYLRDKRVADEHEIVGRWLGSTLLLMHEQEAKGRNLAMREIENLRLDEVRTFYNLEPLALREDVSAERADRRGSHSGY